MRKHLILACCFVLFLGLGFSINAQENDVYEVDADYYDYGQETSQVVMFSDPGVRETEASEPVATETVAEAAPVETKKGWSNFLGKAKEKILGKSAETSSSTRAGYPIVKGKKELAQELVLLRPMVTPMQQFIGEAKKIIPVKTPKNRDKFIRSTLNYRSMAKAHLDSMEHTFTREELQAMIDFYKTPIGQSIQKKSGSYLIGFIPFLKMTTVKGVFASRMLR
ncbi:MAG: DUF2059 domain-containing protein [Alphaproteobacteria bacterium]